MRSGRSASAWAREAIHHRMRRVRGVLKDVRVRQDLVYANLADLVARYGERGVGLTASERKVFSQNGEDGVIAEVFSRIGTTSRFFIEFGIGAGVEGNSVFLAEVLGWSGLFMEADEAQFERLAAKYSGNDCVTTRCSMVTAENIDALLTEASIPSSVDLLSIDIDGNDYWVWKAISCCRPRLVIIEYNGALTPTDVLVQPYNPTRAWGATQFYGSSLAALIDLGRELGYTFVHSDLTGTNAFFIPDELADHFADARPAPLRAGNISLQGWYLPAADGSDDYITPSTTVLGPEP